MDRFLQAQNWLNELSSEAQFFRRNQAPTLDVVEKILDGLGRPDEFFEWRVVVGGTAGKGTVCRRVENTLLREGKTVATLVSPHIQVITERIRINGKLISAESFGESILSIKSAAREKDVQPTYYEAIVCAGILAAKSAGCEVLICEVGLGGLWDAVNAVRGKRIATVTFIGDDHRDILGPTLGKIAETKAGIFTPDCELCLSYDKKYCSIFEKVSSQNITSIKGIPSKLNKKIARKICEKILRHNNFEMQKVVLPCRWEKVASDIIFDGAHSAPRVEFLLPKLRKIAGKKTLVAAMAKNHDPKSFGKMVTEFDEVIWTTVPGIREYWDPSELKNLWGGEVIADPHAALSAARKKEGTVVVSGSFYLAGELRREFFDPQKILEQRTEWPQ